jgi:hypothetical protein
MRSWIGAISAFASVVITQRVSSHSASGSGRQASNSPAIASGAPLRAETNPGCLPCGAGCHS